MMKHEMKYKLGPSRCQFDGCTVSLSNPTPFALISHLGIHSTNKRYTCSGCGYGWAQFHQACTHTKRCESKAIVSDNLSDEMLNDWVELGKICFPDRVDEIYKSGQKQLMKSRTSLSAEDVLALAENRDPRLSDPSFIKEELDFHESSPASLSVPQMTPIGNVDPDETSDYQSESPNEIAETASRKRKLSENIDVKKDEKKSEISKMKRLKLHTPSAFSGQWEESPKHDCASCQQKNDLDQMIICVDCTVIVCGLCAYKKHKTHDGRELLNEEILALSKELGDLIEKTVERHITPLSSLCNETFELYDEIKAEMYNMKALVSGEISWKGANENAEKCRKMIDSIAEVFTEFAAQVQKSNKKLEEHLEMLKVNDLGNENDSNKRESF